MTQKHILSLLVSAALLCGLLAGGSCPSTAVGYYRADDLPGTCNYSHAAAPAAAAPAETAAPEQAVIPADTGNQDTD